MKKLIILVFTILFITSSALAQSSTLKKAWDFFSKNNYENASEYFKDASSSEPEAYLGLCFIAQMESKADEAFVNFEKFYNAHPNPDYYLDALWNSEMVGFFGSSSDKAKLKFFKKIIKEKPLPGRIDAKIHELFGELFIDKSKFKDAEKEFSKIGSVSTWTSVGEFENISGSGYEKGYPPILKPKLDENFTNKNGVEVNWFEIINIRQDRWVDLTYYYYGMNSIVYSQTFVQSEGSRDVQLRFGVSGSIKVWLNDKLILAESEERNNDFDSYIISTELANGYNRILVQTGESEADAHNFMLRITDDKGFPIPDLTFDNQYHNYKKNDNLKFEIIENPTEQYFKELAKNNPENLLYQILLAQCYLNADKKYETRKTLSEAEKLAPNNTYIKIKLFEIYRRENNSTGMAKLLEWFKNNDITNSISLNLRFNEAMDNKNYTKADSILNLMKENEAIKEEYLENYIEYLNKREMTEDLVGVVKDAYKKYPNNYSFVSLMASIEKDMNQNVNRAITIYRKYLKHKYRKDVKQELASLFFSKNEILEGLRLFSQIVKNDPSSLSHYKILSEIYTAIRDYENSIRAIDKCIEMAPYIGSYYESKGKCYEEMKDEESAMTNYDLALKFSPYNYDVRKRIRKLKNENEDVFSSFEKIDVYKEAAQAKASDYPDENSAIIVLDNQKVVYSSCASEEKVTLVVKVFTSAGIDIWKEYNIPYSSNQNVTVEKVEVIKANGTKLEAERSNEHVVFTNLEIGDAIHVCYKIDHFPVGRIVQQFWDDHYFSINYPAKINRYALLIAPSVKFNHKFTNGGFEPVVTDKAGMKMYVWKKTNVDYVKKEKYMSRIVDYGEVLQLSTIPDWNYISQWYANLANSKSKPEYDVKEIVAELFKDKKNISNYNKAKIIHEYIVKNIRYSSVSFRQSGLIPQKAAHVLNTRIGDCKDVSTLFISMCKEAGIDSAGLVLINTRNNGKKDLILPSIEFNHCIASFSDKGKKYFVELTSDKLGFNSHGDYLIKSIALPITSILNNGKNETFYLESPQRMKDQILRETTITFNNKEQVIETTTLKTGNEATETRGSYGDISETERRKKLTDAITYGSNQTKLHNYSFEKLDAVSDSITYKYNYTIVNGVTPMAGLNIFSLPWTGRLINTDVVIDVERKTPFLLWDYFDYDVIREVCYITLPAGKNLAEPLKDVSFDTDWFKYKIQYKVTGSKITATRELSLKKDVVEAEKFADFKTIFEKIVESDTKQIAFK